MSKLQELLNLPGFKTTSSGVEWRETADGLVPYYTRPGKAPQQVVWAPQPGSQEAFLSCPVFEVLYEGTRGPGKSDALIMDFCRDVGKGWGLEWKGIIFRRSYPDLKDIIDKSKKWIPQLWPGAVFNETKTMWTWPTGEQLLFRQFDKPSDYWKYHGHAYPWQGWEELTQWPTDEGYKKMFSCCRSSRKGIPKRIRATTNPYGVGHNWVKFRFRLPLRGEDIIGPTILNSFDETGKPEPARCAIRGMLKENKILLYADPDYEQNVRAAAKNRSELMAWLVGSWDIVAGGMFDDVWDNRVHVIRPFTIPPGWRIDRSFDWGSSRPFSVGWWAESDGSDVQLADGTWMSTVPGDTFRICEWYGCTGKPNEGLKMLAYDIGRGIVEREMRWGIYNRVKAGPADSAIFDVENGVSIALDMEKKIRLEDGRIVNGVSWTRADKRPGSRKTGWELMRKMMQHAKKPKKGGPRENPGLFVFSSCQHFIRTVPVLPRDDKDLDDVNSEAEDHIGDETRYRLRAKGQRVGTGTTTGMY